LIDVVQTVTQVFFILNIVFAIVIVFFERRHPTATWAWLMLLAFLPFFGFIVYLLLGMQGRKYRRFVHKAREDEALFNKYRSLEYDSLKYLSEQKGFIENKNILLSKGGANQNNLIYMNYKAGHGDFSQNNRLTIFYEGTEKFEQLLEDIENAKYFIHIQYYILRNDALGRLIIRALADKCAEGVEVRLFVDGMGCVGTGKKIYKPFLKAGGKLAIFLPPHFVRVNYRNHRKLCVIDGGVGYIGGLNIGNEYIGRSKAGFWRDTHLRVVGDAVKQMELRFIMDWNYVKRKDRIQLDNMYFPPARDVENGACMQIVSSGPDTHWSNVHHGYAKMIFAAEKSIYIETPYFVPDDSIFKALRIAALSDVDVRIIIPAHPDHPFVYWASLYYLGELLPAGIKCYKYEKGFIHSKLMIIDSQVSSAGTANMDMRSFELNFEVNAFIYDAETAKELQRQFLEDLEDCTEITKEDYDNRSQLTRVKESLSRLLSPLL